MVVVTRPAGQEAELVARLRALGHDVEHIPLIEIEPLGDDPIDVSGYDWVVLTSANGARELRRRMVGAPGRVAAIGQATADAFGGADLIAGVSTQEGLLAELPPSPGKVLFAAAEGARRLLPEAIGADAVALYRARPALTGRIRRRPGRPRIAFGGTGARGGRCRSLRSSRSGRRRRRQRVVRA